MGGTPAAFVLDKSGLGKLIDTLRQGGYRVVGPTERDAAIIYDEIASVDDLPRGRTDEQSGGKYRLRDRADGAFFGYAVGPHAWKRFLHPPRIRLFRAERRGNGFDAAEDPQDPPRWAFLGVRPCEIAAIAIQDRVLLGGAYVDPTYRARRERALIIAVNCGDPAATCFCASMQTGPRAASGYDLALTEILAEGRHEFLAEVGSRRGGELLARMEPRAAREEDHRAAADTCRRAEERMGRKLDTRGVRELLQRNAENPRWDEIATRCLACANCTMVCPTCFCTSVEDTMDLSGRTAERWRNWDSCYTTEFSYIHGGAIRTSGRARYRQWLTHKLASWHDQFGTSGCVGCGRCITWCPVGIDLTVEVEAIRAADTPDRLVQGGV